MKNYEKVYENVFANKQSLERLKWDKITIIDDEPVESWSKKVKELVKENELKPLLEKMGYGYVNSEVIVPCYRVDILSEIDIIEDIAVAYGYENFKPEISNFSSIAHEDEFESFKNKLANMMVGFGLLETNTYNLAKKNDQTKNMRLNLSLVEIENALNEEYNVLRSWMLPSLLDVFKNNKHHENPQKIFEIGTVFNSEEKSKLGMLITHSSVTYTEARQVLDSLIASLGLEVSIKSSEHESFIPGRVGRIIVKGKDVGVIGEIHPEVLSNFELETPVVGFELDIMVDTNSCVMFGEMDAVD